MILDDRARTGRAGRQVGRSLVLLPSAALAAFLLASASSPAVGVGLNPAPTTRVADPKLTGGGVSVSYYLEPPSTTQQVIVEALDGATVVRTISNSTQTGSATPYSVFWNGLDSLGDYVDTGDYTVRVRVASGAATPVTYPVTIVRLGVTEIEALPATLGSIGEVPKEYQMVYFKKLSAPAYYVTPAIHEYINVAEPGDVSDLDRNDSTARPSAPLHVDTAQPVMSGANYELESYNYPLCYLHGSQPRFQLKLGTTSTSASGGQQGVGYPIAGVEIRAALSAPSAKWVPVNDEVTLGGTLEFVGPALPKGITRTDWLLTHSFLSSTDGGATWQQIPGSFTTRHRFYTVIGEPNFAPGDPGLQYGGPWVEVADYVALWADGLDIATDTEAGVVAAGIQGFFGQQGPLPTAIEGVVYDCPSEGGDGGANHYFINSQHRIDLSALLNNHANGVFLNCSDCAGSSSTMLAMLGVDNVQLVHLGSMTLKAIWGIGTDAYTTNLWGGGSHGFSFHKIITRDAGVHVSDACMCLDEDGSPNTTPGIPGYNCDREWEGVPLGYEFLSAYNQVSKTIQALPKLR